MARRAFGSIDQLQSGRWRARYRDGAGRAHSRVFKTKTDASAFLATIETDLLRGDWNDPRLTGVPVRVWAEQWFETTAHLKPKTRVEYASNLRNHVLPFFGDKPVGAIDALGVRQFVSTLRGGWARARHREEGEGGPVDGARLRGGGGRDQGQPVRQHQDRSGRST